MPRDLASGLALLLCGASVLLPDCALADPTLAAEVDGDESTFGQSRLTPRLTPRPQAPPSPGATPPVKPAPAPPPPASPRATPPPSTQPDPGQASTAAPAKATLSPNVAPAPVTPTAQTAGVFQPPVLLAYSGMEPPPGYREESFFNRGFLIGGGITLGVTYGAGLIFGATQKFEGGLGTLAIPLIGPWIALGKRNFECDTTVPTVLDPDAAADAADECQQLLLEETKVAIVLFGIGLGQLAGAVITTIGLADRETRWLRADIGGVDVQFDPLTSPSMAGILASGRF